MAKISILGASGTIGKNVAFTLAKEDTIDEIVMYCREKSYEKLKGEVLDMYDALAAEDIDVTLKPTSHISDIANSDVVLISAGIPREKNMKRIELAVPNAKIVSDYSKNVAKYAPESIILIATNPVDVMTTIALESSEFDKTKVIGLGNHLDSLRLKTILSKHFKINSREVHTRVIGEHGDHMVPLLSSTTIGGIPLEYFNKSMDLDGEQLIKQVRNAGANIINRKGATEYGPAYAISNLIVTIISDSRKILTVSTYLEGEVEGVYDVSLGVPVVLSKNGIEMIVPVGMNADERTEFFDAARTIKNTIRDVRKSLL